MLIPEDGQTLPSTSQAPQSGSTSSARHAAVGSPPKPPPPLFNDSQKVVDALSILYTGSKTRLDKVNVPELKILCQRFLRHLQIDQINAMKKTDLLTQLHKYVGYYYYLSSAHSLKA